MKKLLLIMLCCCISSAARAQSGSTEVYLVDMLFQKDSIRFGTPVNITNHEGYDNQPEFSPDGKKIIYVSMPDTSQAELFEYTIADSSVKQLTYTSESEFSPRFYSGKNHLSFVRVDADKGQRLYSSGMEFTDVEDVIFGLDSIGYYRWLNDSMIALACLNNGMELFIYEINSGQYIIPVKGIGRCLLKFPGSSDLLFTKKAGIKIQLYRYSTTEELAIPYFDGLDDVEDYVFLPDGRLLGGQDGKLFISDPEKNISWNEIADFSKIAGSFYRIEVSRDAKHMAFVAFKGKRP